VSAEGGLSDVRYLEPSVGIVIVTWNNERDVIECLRSVARLEYRAKGVVVVDNGSDTGLVPVLTTEFPTVHVVATGRNLGVPSGFNVGIEEALVRGAEYVLILNDDTIVAPDMLRLLVDAALQHPDAGILMPKMLMYDKPNVIWSAGARYRRFPPAIVFIDRNRRDAVPVALPKRIAYAPACGLLIPGRTFEDVGLFDSGYFFFYEDMDYCERVRAAGRGVLYVPTARLWHKVSRSTQRSSDLFWRVWGESSALFYRRYGGPAMLSVAVHVGYLVARELVLGNARRLPTFLRGVRAGLTRPLRPAPKLGPPARPIERPSPSATN
jgi:GT2 family glycosyltransferase